MGLQKADKLLKVDKLLMQRNNCNKRNQELKLHLAPKSALKVFLPVNQLFLAWGEAEAQQIQVKVGVNQSTKEMVVLNRKIS